VGAMRIWGKSNSQGLETVWVVSSTELVVWHDYSKITAILAAANGALYAYIINSMATY